MKLAVWIALVAVGVAELVAGVGGALGVPGLAVAVFGGLGGPLLAAVATRVAVVRASRTRSAVMRVMVAAFLAKAVFFTVYVVVMIKVAGVPARAFGLSFVSWFIALYAVEAALLARRPAAGATGAW